ncbi:MAG TPA: DUF4129 domain-containing protein [Mycobacterium sp.]|nr:DUF4129 domain-containing protein [Mycobacterium sp.]
MPGIDKATGRAATALALMVLAVIALRGYLPGGQPAPADTPGDSAASLIAVVALLTVALAGLAFAVITTPRRAGGAAGAEPVRTELRGLRVRLRWRWALVGFAMMACWLFAVLLITQLTPGLDSTTPAPRTPSSPQAPAPGSPAPARPPNPADSDGSALPYLATATAIMLLVLAFGAITGRARPTVPVGDDASIEPPSRPTGPESLARAAELGLVQIADLSREPRAAIIACYVAMEYGLSLAPGAAPRDSDTPSEVIARAVHHHALSTGSATELVELFTEARFSPHVMTEHHRDSAVRALRRVLDELRSGQ